MAITQFGVDTVITDRPRNAEGITVIVPLGIHDNGKKLDQLEAMCVGIASPVEGFLSLSPHKIGNGIKVRLCQTWYTCRCVCVCVCVCVCMCVRARVRVCV